MTHATKNKPSVTLSTSGVALARGLLWQKLTGERSLCQMNGQSPNKNSRLRNWVVTPNSTLAAGLLGSLLFWLALPPVAWGALAWLAPIPCLALVLRPKLPGRRPYRALWLAGMVFWLFAVHWIRLPHPLNHLALLVLASYLGIYLPLMVGLSRVAVHRFGLPLWLAAPIVWAGLDWLRGRLLTGFLMASLAHTQAKTLIFIQIADVFGEYGVTFLIVLVASCLIRFLASFFSVEAEPSSRPKTYRLVLHLLPGAIAIAATVFYGISHLAVTRVPAPSELRIALIQGNTLANWKGDSGKQADIVKEYLALSQEAVQESNKKNGRAVDLVIWPETTFRQPLVTVEKGYKPPEDRVHASYLTGGQSQLAELTKILGSAVFVGIDRIHIFPDDEGQPDYDSYNSSVLVDSEGKILGTYDKMHRVPFGEYIPFADWFPILYRLTPLTGGVLAGQRPGSDLWLEKVLISPNICYETAVPHLIRRQVLGASDRDMPQLMVNITNDAWYWGSSELDMHLACGVFRAIEMRTPLVIAANGGLSASIDPWGGIRQVTKRQQTEFLLVDLQSPSLESPYRRWGDWFAISCVVCCIVLAISSVASSANRG